MAAAGVPAPEFDPLSIDWDLAYWADDPDWTNPGDGNPVSSWRDAGTLAEDATQATSVSQPTFRSSVAAFNDRATVEFDGGDDLTTAIWTPAMSTGEVFLVGRLSTLAADDGFFNGRGGHRWRFGYIGGVWDLSQGGTHISGGSPDTAAHAFLLAYEATDRITVDGTSVTSGAEGTETLDQLRIGGWTAVGSASGYMIGDIAFLGIKDGGLSAIEESNLLAWARAYYGTP